MPRLVAVQDDISRLASLAEPVRRQLYNVVSQTRGWLSREQAAAEAGIPLHVAKFHLDRLVSSGLLDIDYRRLTGRRGPGAGRPAKLYRRSNTEISVTVPPRQYDLLSRILAAAVVESQRLGRNTEDMAIEIAHQEGVEHARDAGPTAATSTGRLCQSLIDIGFEPDVSETTIDLINCPFHAVAQRQTALVCGINLAFVDGLIDGLPCPEAIARLNPGPERCCVTIDLNG